MSRLIIIRGNSGSGKSTLAKHLQHALGRNTMVISQDTVRREMLWVRDRENNPAIGLMHELMKYGHAHCEVTILEGILYSEIYAPLFRAALDLFGPENIFAFYYDIPFDETLRRHETKSVKFEFGEADMRRWWREKDFIGYVPETVFSEDVSLEDALESIFRALSR